MLFRSPFGSTDFWTTSPNQFLLRSGLVLLLAGAIARASAGGHQRLPFVAQAITRESLTIYAAHLALVYGSPVNRGLHQRIGQTQALIAVLAWVAVTCAAMTILAVSWHWCKLRRPRLAVAARLALGAFLLTRVI